MNILAIETASEACSVALAAGDHTRSRFALAPRGHAERVLPWVDELLGQAGLAMADLDVIAFSRGPGSFTSLRIGISVVQGLAWGAEVPVVPLSSLQITAQAAARRGAERVLVAMDARMDEVFCGRFDRDDAGLMRPVGVEQVCAPEQAAALVAEEVTGIGNGFGRYPVLREAAATLKAVHDDVWPTAEIMPVMALDWLREHEPLPAAGAQPVYLRDNVAQKSHSV